MARSEDPRVAVREQLVAGEATRALALAEAALDEARPAPEDAVALHVLAAQAARSLGDVPGEVRHLEAAEETAASEVPAALGATRLQLGLAHLRRGELKEAERVLKDALPVLADDPEQQGRAAAALGDTRARLAESPPLPRAGGDRAALAAMARSKVARGRVYRMLEKLYETDPEAPAQQVLVSFLDELVAATAADRGFVLLSEPDGLVVRAARDAGGNEVLHPHLEVSFSIAKTAALEGRTLVAVKPADDPRFAKSRSAKRLALKAVCAAPVRFRREAVAVVVLDRKTSEGGFDKTAEALIAEFAKGAAGLIYRARRQDAERAAYAAQLEEYVKQGEKARGRLRAHSILGSSPPILFLLQLIEKVAATDARVLIRGESGTGKELVARTLHENSKRRKGPFVAVNCGALADTVLEKELFGHAAGAFTGANEASQGLIRSADGGTLFLDEVATASPRLQVALLRFLENAEVRPVGGEVVKVDVRVVAATNEDLEGLVAAGRFRLDLLHRLNAVPVPVPSLRERKEDIPILARQFALEAACGDEDRVAEVLSARALLVLSERPFPGNVRELRNAVQELVAVGSLPATVDPKRRRILPKDPGWKDAPERVPTLREAERRTIQAALAVCEGNKLRAARLLGISRRGLYYLMEDHRIPGTAKRRRRARG